MSATNNEWWDEVRQVESLSSLPPQVAFFHNSLRMGPNSFLWIMIIPTSHRWIYLLRRKPQLRCYYPSLDAVHSDQDPFLCPAIAPLEAKLVSKPFSPVIYAQTDRVIYHKPTTNNSHDFWTFLPSQFECNPQIQHTYRLPNPPFTHTINPLAL